MITSSSTSSSSSSTTTTTSTSSSSSSTSSSSSRCIFRPSARRPVSARRTVMRLRGARTEAC